jgi:UDP-N-acetyl-D-glucosamine dehydrogenase
MTDGITQYVGTNGHNLGESQVELQVQTIEANSYGQQFVVAGSADLLMDKIATRQAVVGVIGLGYVGLPLAVAYAEAGFQVVGFDIDKRRVADLNAGKSPVADVPSQVLASLIAPPMRTNHLPAKETNGYHNGAARAGSICATTDFSLLAEVDAVIICVPTPLSASKDPDMSYIIAAADAIAEWFHPGMLVVLESTTYPGTTEEVILPRLEQAPRSRAHGAAALEYPYAVGQDFFLAFSPERIDPGRIDYTVRTTPKVIGGMTPACLEVARMLYACAIDNVVPVSSPKAAEMVKLLENTFRSVNIGLMNEMAIMCERLEINVWEVIDAAKTKPFGFMPFYPGPGLGGHCIPIDPLYLAWKLKTLNYNARFIQLASEVNLGMPHYVLGRIADALNDRGKALKGARVLILGMAYKADIGDLRESPALDLLHLLREKGADVHYHDPFVAHLKLDGQTMTSETLDENLLQSADCVVIATAHTSYDWEWVIKHSHLIMDTRNATRHAGASLAHVVRL